MKYIPLHGQPCKLYELYYPYRDNLANYIKYIHKQGQPYKLYEIHIPTVNFEPRGMGGGGGGTM